MPKVADDYIVFQKNVHNKKSKLHTKAWIEYRILMIEEEIAKLRFVENKEL